MKTHIKPHGYQGDWYSGPYTDPAVLIATVNKIIITIENTIGKDNFNSIAYRGNSGAIVAPTVAIMMDKSLILSRKDFAHSDYNVEGPTRPGTRFIFLDDFICGGDTFIKTYNDAMSLNSENKLVAAVSYYSEFDSDSISDINGISFRHIKIEKVTYD